MRSGGANSDHSSDGEGGSISLFRRIVGSILISCLVTVGAAAVFVVLIAILDLYLSGHRMEPPHWTAIREWLFIGSLVAVFSTTLLVLLKVAPNRS